MTLQPFKYAPADSLRTAEALLREHGSKAAVIAGGTDLLGTLKDAVHDAPPAVLIGRPSSITRQPPSRAATLTSL